MRTDAFLASNGTMARSEAAHPSVPELAWTLTAAGMKWFDNLGIEVPAKNQRLLRPCMDWTERRPHAAGVLANSLAARAFDRGWVIRGSHTRSANLTPQGRDALGLTQKLSPASHGDTIPVLDFDEGHG